MNDSTMNLLSLYHVQYPIRAQRRSAYQIMLLLCYLSLLRPASNRGANPHKTVRSVNVYIILGIYFMCLETRVPFN